MTTVEYEIYLPQPVGGETLIEAVRQAAGSKFARDGMIVGQSSKYPYEDVVIATGQDFTVRMIKPDRSYTCLAVQDYEWPGMKFCIGYDDDAVIKAVKKFRDNLLVVLAEKLGVSVKGIQQLTAAREGMAHGDARYVCDHCGNGLSTNLGPCKHCGAPVAELTPLW